MAVRDSQLQRIAVLVPDTPGYCDGVMRGIAKFSRLGQSWAIHWQSPILSVLPEVKQWNPAGIITCLWTEEFAKEILKLKKPLVNVKGVVDMPGVPRVSVDHRALGRVAAEHLLTRGFRNLACLTIDSRSDCSERVQGFLHAASLKGIEPPVYSKKRQPSRDSPTYYLGEDFKVWLNKLPKPLGLFAVDDFIGLAVTEEARELGINIPEDLAVVGADDNETVCLLATPPLSSVRAPQERIGYEAAQLLSQMLAGEKVSPVPTELPPMGVITRQSSDTVAISDPELTTAMLFIRENSSRPITVRDVLKEVPLSRRVLEQRFRSVLGRSPMEVIRRSHISRAKQMLAETDEPMPRVAEKCGFSSAVHLSVLFSRETGIAPADYRKQFRLR